MFFDEDIKKIEYFGTFSPENFDNHLSFLDVMYDRIYSRWKFHYLCIFSLLIILTLKFPVFLSFIFIDIVVQYCFNKNNEEFLNQSNSYDLELYKSQLDGSDSRLNPYIFLFYDNLNYIIYNNLEINENISEELFEYNFYLGLQNFLYNHTLNKNVNLLLKKENYKISNINKINYIKYKINDLIYINFIINKFNNLMYNYKKYNCNNFLLYNLDRSFVYFNLNK